MSPSRTRSKSKASKPPKGTKVKAKPVDTRTGSDRRSGVDRRQRHEPVANDRRSGADRRSGLDRRRYRGMDARLRMRVVLLIGAILAYPAVRTYLDGALAIDAAAIRVAIAFGFAGLAVGGVNALLIAYTPTAASPGVARPDIEDAETIDDATGGV